MWTWARRGDCVCNWRGPVGELDDDPTQRGLVQGGVDEGGDVVAADLAVVHRETSGDLAVAGLVAQETWAHDEPVQVRRGQVHICRLLDSHVVLEVIAKLPAALGLWKRRHKNKSSRSRPRGGRCRLLEAFTVDEAGLLSSRSVCSGREHHCVVPVDLGCQGVDVIGDEVAGDGRCPGGGDRFGL